MHTCCYVYDRFDWFSPAHFIFSLIDFIDCCKWFVVGAFFCFFFYFLGSLHLYLSFSIHFFSLCLHVRRFLNTTFFCTSSYSCWIWRSNRASYYLTTRCFIHSVLFLLFLSSSFIWLHHFYQIGTGILAFFFPLGAFYLLTSWFFSSRSLSLSFAHCIPLFFPSFVLCRCFWCSKTM